MAQTLHFSLNWISMNVSVYKPCTLLAALLCGTALCQTTLHTKTTLVVVPTIVTTEGKDVAFSLWSARLALYQWLSENWTRRAYGTREEVPA